MTDERDPGLSQAYRELGGEEPPRALDDAILAAAHRTERTHPAPLLSPGVGRTARERWTFPLAAAAVIMLSVGVVMHLQLEQPGIDGILVSPEAARPAPPAPVAESPKAEPKKPESPKQEDTVLASRMREAPPKLTARPAKPAQELVVPAPKPEARAAASGPFVPDPAPVAAPAAAPAVARPAPPPAASAGSAAGAATAPRPMAMQRSEEGMRDRADHVERQALGEATAKRSQDAGETPDKWLERIAQLRRAGKHEEADKALAEFRQRHPGYRIPEPMLERVERR